MRKKRIKQFLRVCCHLIFILYLLLLVKIVLFKYSGFLTALDKLITGKLNGFRSYNLIPFQSIREFVKLMFRGYVSRGFNNLVGNILIFAPFGYFVPLLYKRCRKWQAVVLAGFFVGLVFELCQYVLYLGSADIDDLILNLLGVVLGFLFYQAVKRFTYKKQTVRYLATMILSVVGFIVAGCLAVDYFGIMFGIKNQSNQSDLSGGSILQSEFRDNEQVAVTSNDQSGEEQLEDRSGDEFDIWGDITARNGSSITINKTKIEDLGNGMVIASASVQNPDLQTVWITETTKFFQKDIYDASGNKVETSEVTSEALKVEKHIHIKGYQLDQKLIATEIVIQHLMF